MVIVSRAPFALHFCPQKYWSRQICWIICVLQTETLTNRCCVNRQINVSLLSKKYQTAVDQFWLTDWQTDAISDCWSCTAFCCDSFSLLRQLCTVGHRIFLYIRCKQLFVIELNSAYFSRHLFQNGVWVLHNSLLHLLFKNYDFLNTDISQGSVATRLGCGLNVTVTNFLLSLTVKEFWKSANIWWSYGQ